LTRIDFYVLADGARDNRYTLACRLTDKIFREGHRVYLYTESEQDARHLDRLLWTFRDQSFVPHGLAGQTDPELTRILIGWNAPPEGEEDVLINLSPEVPGFFSRFSRVAEPVDNEPAVRQAGRQRFRFYRARGYPLHSHSIAGRG
jgi:DNA polymerase-3 subunit chi